MKFDTEGDVTGLIFKWTSVKPGGFRPAPRSGVNVTVAPNGKAYIFGGVLDVNEDEERLDGQFSNEMHMLELSNQTWRLVELKGKKEAKSKSSGDKEQDDYMDTSATSSTQGTFSQHFFENNNENDFFLDCPIKNNSNSSIIFVFYSVIRWSIYNNFWWQFINSNTKT